MKNNRAIGNKYEHIAGQYLISQGVEILEYNFACKKSEIDIIGRLGDIVLFVEVKYRSSSNYGFPEASVNGLKQEKIRYGAKVYLTKNNLYDIVPCRFDVVSITGNNIVWIKDAF